MTDELLPDLWRDHIRLTQLAPDHAYSQGGRPILDDFICRGLYTYDILLSRNWTLHMTLEEKLGLPPAFPTALSKITSKFGFYCKYDGRFIFQNFHSAYAARVFLDTIISGVPMKWTKENEVLLENGMTIRSEGKDQLADALEHTLAGPEVQWQAPEPYPRIWLSFIGKRPFVIANPHQTPAKTKRRQQSPDEKRTKAVAKVRSGDHITISQIADELKTEPRVLRALLRKLNIDKPDHGWAWPPSEATRIKSRLAGLLRGAPGA